jgi:uncharacterized protein
MNKYLIKVWLLAFVLFSSPVFAFTEKPVSFSESPFELFGTLTIPEGSGPFPVIILNHGSGPSDRDQTISQFNCLLSGLVGTTLKPNRDLAHFFASKGFAVLRYDKRSYTYGQSMPLEDIFGQFIYDIHRAVDFVKTQAEIDTSKIILSGYSKSGNLVPVVANERDDISAIILLVSSPTPVDTLLPDQIRHIYKHCADEQEGEQIAQELEAAFQEVREGTASGSIMGLPPSYWMDWIEISESTIPNLDKISIPLLLLFAGDDYQVPPVEAGKFQNRLSREADIWIIDGVNHFLTPADDPKVDMRVTDTLYYWLSDNQFTSISTKPEPAELDIRFTEEEWIIILPGEESNASLNISNLAGQKLRSISGTNSLRISRNSLPVGVYLIHGLIDGVFYKGKLVF